MTQDTHFDPLRHPHRRLNLLTGRSVIVSAHRSQRPWSGQQEAVQRETLPDYDPGCYLCPGNRRSSGQVNPAYESTFAFDNDFAALTPDTPAPPAAAPGSLMQAGQARGSCRVICFSPDHALTLPQMSLAALHQVVRTWIAESRELSQHYRCVQVFENKGAMMGCSSPHPHGQIWATDYLPDEVVLEDDRQRAYLAKHGRPLLVDYVAQELADGARTVVETQHWLAVVPFWASWPFETLLCPKRHTPRLIDLDDAQQRDLALALKRLTARYDNLFGVSFPYSMGWHEAPHDDSDAAPWQLHAHFFPPLQRSATIRKFMAGFELLAETQRDLTPEQAAERLRAVADELAPPANANSATAEREALIATVRAGFRAGFGGEPTALARAPGRVNLIGEHTDYSEGFCLPCAIDFETLVAWRPRADGVVRVLACDQGGAMDSFRLDDGDITPTSEQPWANYVRGTLAAMLADGLTPGGADIAIAGNVPQGAGLSSSASLEMAVATAFEHGMGLQLAPGRKARLGQLAEHEFAGCMCGIMDQLASAAGEAGHALLLDCRSLQTETVPLPADVAVLVLHSRVQRGLVDSEYNLRRQQCQQAAAALGLTMLRDADIASVATLAGRVPDAVLRRARHVVTDNARTLQMAQALRANDLQQAGRLMRASHASMRDDFEIVPPAVDELAAIVNEVLAGLGGEGGARMTGGGFGGCVVALARTASVEAVREAVMRRYRSPGGEPALFWQCRASAGAGLLA